MFKCLTCGVTTPIEALTSEGICLNCARNVYAHRTDNPEVLADSGDRTEFDTGAMRDMGGGKGRCDLLPAGALVRMFIDGVEIKFDLNDANHRFLCYMRGDDDHDYLAELARWAMQTMEHQEGSYVTGVYPLATLRLARHYELGTKKYADRNWEKGLPISSFIDSGYRHFLKYVAGWTDEDHLAAVAWNVLGAMWTEDMYPEKQDLPSRAE